MAAMRGLCNNENKVALVSASVSPSESKSTCPAVCGIGVTGPAVGSML